MRRFFLEVTRHTAFQFSWVSPPQNRNAEHDTPNHEIVDMIHIYTYAEQYQTIYILHAYIYINWPNHNSRLIFQNGNTLTSKLPRWQVFKFSWARTKPQISLDL
jgi:hypothetical protein